jgi:hypothetical protein
MSVKIVTSSVKLLGYSVILLVLCILFISALQQTHVISFIMITKGKISEKKEQDAFANKLTNFHKRELLSNPLATDKPQ